jgi:DNA-binding LytR/AlgR family response regulator
MRCLIIEDEPLAAERLTDYIARLPLLQLVGTFDNATDAMSWLMGNPVDLVFLDISLGGMSGIELLETMTVNGQVILTTAHPEFALKGYDLKVADYLLKPITFPRFVQAVERAQSLRPAVDAPVERGLIFVRTEFRLEKVRLADVLYIEGDGDYRQIHTVQKRLATAETLTELEARLPVDRICRVHKSYMVALDKIDAVERDRISIRNKLIPVSATYRDRFYALIGHGAPPR